MRVTLAVLLLALGCLAAGADRAPAEESPAKPVKAQRYRVLWVDGDLDLAHGGGRWVDEVYLPEAKVAATLVHDQEILPAARGEPLRMRPRVRMFARHADGPRNDSTGSDATPSALTDFEVPADLAKAMIALAELTARQEAETVRLGQEAAKRLGWPEIPPERALPR